MIVNNNQKPDAVNLSDKLSAQSNLAETQATPRAASTGGTAGAATDHTPGDDSITLSDSSALVQQALSATSPARSARTQELKALVQSNQYQPDGQQLSVALIDAHLTGA